MSDRTKLILLAVFLLGVQVQVLVLAHELNELKRTSVMFADNLVEL